MCVEGNICDMRICFLSCGIYQPELDAVLSEIKEDKIFDCELTVTYLQAKLHIDFDLLKKDVLQALRHIAADKIILLYGAKCHPEFNDFLRDWQLVRFKQSNCIELILGDCKKKIDDAAKTIYLTAGWVTNWDQFFNAAKNTDQAAIKQSFADFGQLLFIDTGVCEVPNKKIEEISLYTGLPKSVKKVGLSVFKSNIIKAVKQALPV